VKGHAVVKRQGQELDATPSMPVLPSDEIATDAGGGATITLLNGSRLTLGESTSIVIDQSIIIANQRVKSLTHLCLRWTHVGNADAPVIEGDLSSWRFLHSRHPIDFSFTSTQFYQNGITSSLIDLRTIVYSSGKWFFSLEVAEPSGRGDRRKTKRPGGPDLGISSRMGPQN
jgi:hypothetical protein